MTFRVRSLRFFLPALLLGMVSLLNVCAAQKFAAPVTVPTGNHPAAVYAVDLNGDSFSDLVVIDAGATPNNPSTTRVLLSDGKGGFTSSAVLATIGSSVGIGDFDGDGKPDIAWLDSILIADPVQPYYITTIHVAPGQGDGTFGAVQTSTVKYIGGVQATDPPQLWQHLQAAQVNASGHMDLLAEEGLHKFCADFTLNMVAGRSFGVNCGSLDLGTGPILVADLNRDGLNDLLVTDSTAQETFIDISRNSANHFQNTSSAPLGNTESVLATDMDGDSIPDLIAADPAGRIDIFAGYGDGTFATVSKIGTGTSDASTGHGGHLIAAADLNGDCTQDLLTSTPLGISVLLGQRGTLNFTLDQIYAPTTPTPTSFAVGDFNNDGHPDLAMDGPQGVIVLFGVPGNMACKNGAVVTGSLAASPEPSGYGRTFTLTATLTGTVNGSSPTGSVTFSVDGTVVGTSPVSGNTATYTVTVPTYAVGSHTTSAAYTGDANYNALTLSGTHAISLLPSQTYLTNFITPIHFGEVIGEVAVAHADAAVVTDTASTIGGVINVFIDGVNVCVLPVAAGTSSCPSTTGAGYSAGVHTIYLQYTGNQYYGPSTSVTYSAVVQPDDTVTTLTSSANPAFAGSPVTFTATVSSGFLIPTGNVSFYDGSTLLFTAPLSQAGNAVFTTSSLTVGTHNVTAQYAATQNFNASTSPVVAQVILPLAVPSSIVLASSLNPSLLGQAVTFTAAVTTSTFTGSLTGNVNFVDGATALATVPLNASGTASFTTSSLTLGNHSITAVYVGNGNALPSVSTVLVQVVNAVPISGFTLSVTPAALSIPIGSSVSVVVTVIETGGYNQPIALSCSGLVRASACNFGVATIPAGGGSTRLTVSAAAPHNCDNSTPYFVASGPSMWLSAVGTGLLVFLLRRRRNLVRGIALTIALSILPAISGCSGHCTDLGVRPGNYTFTVTGTSTGSPSTSVSQTLQMVAHI